VIDGWTNIAARAKAKVKAYHHNDLPGALIREALKALSKTGEADFTLRSLARRIGVSHAAPYAHFPTKTALLAAIASAGFEAAHARLRAASAAAAAGGPRGQLVAASRAAVQWGLENPALYRLMFGAELGADSYSYPKLKAASHAAYETLLAHVRALRPGDDGKGAWAAWPMVHGLTMLLLDNRIGHGGSIEDESAIRSVLEIVVAGIEARPAGN